MKYIRKKLLRSLRIGPEQSLRKQLLKDFTVLLVGQNHNQSASCTIGCLSGKACSPADLPGSCDHQDPAEASLISIHKAFRKQPPDILFLICNKIRSVCRSVCRSILLRKEKPDLMHGYRAAVCLCEPHSHLLKAEGHGKVCPKSFPQYFPIFGGNARGDIHGENPYFR